VLTTTSLLQATRNKKAMIPVFIGFPLARWAV